MRWWPLPGRLDHHNHGSEHDINHRFDLYDDGTIVVYDPDRRLAKHLGGDHRRAALVKLRAAIDAELGDVMHPQIVLPDLSERIAEEAPT